MTCPCKTRSNTGPQKRRMTRLSLPHRSYPPAGDTPSPWKSPPAVLRERCACTYTSHWPVGRHIWEVLVYPHPLCSRLSRHSLPGVSASGPLLCDALGAIFDEVVLKAVLIVVPHSARSIYYQRFLGDI